MFLAQSGERDYALKIMASVQTEKPGGLARFKTEALALGGLPRHQALTGFVEIFQASPDGPWWLVMNSMGGPVWESMWKRLVRCGLSLPLVYSACLLLGLFACIGLAS